MKITSTQLIAIDRFMDRSFFFSSINNIVNLFLKAILHFQSPPEQGKPLTNYWTYIAQKDLWTCGLGLIPVGGTCLIACKNAVEKWRANADFLNIQRTLGIEENDDETVQGSDVEEQLDKLKPTRQANIWKSEAFVHFAQNSIEIPLPLLARMPVEQLYLRGQLSFAEVPQEEDSAPSLKEATFVGKTIAYTWAARKVLLTR